MRRPDPAVLAAREALRLEESEVSDLITSASSDLISQITGGLVYNSNMRSYVVNA